MCTAWKVCNIYLIDAEVWVRGDHGPSGEVHSLPHEIPSDSSLLSLQPCPDGLEGLARPLCLLRLPRSFVIEQGGHLGKKGKIYIEEKKGKTEKHITYSFVKKKKTPHHKVNTFFSPLSCAKKLNITAASIERNNKYKNINYTLVCIYI